MNQSTPLIRIAALAALMLFGGAGCQTGNRGEPWTIECLSLQQPGHDQNAEAVAEALRQSKGISSRKVFVRHDDQGSKVYYGQYYRNIDRERGVREIPRGLSKDLAAIKELVDDRGRRLFIAARMVREPVPDVGMPEYDLTNARGIYTLQVAAFEPASGHDSYKQAAADYAEHLRDSGYEAYYHHGESTSVVTVGTFGADAVVMRAGRTDYSNEVRELQRKEDFKYNLTNGNVWYAVVDGEKAPVRSLLVRIPQPDPLAP